MTTDSIRVFGVIGAGQMGSGIAQVAAAAGWKVILSDIALEHSQRSVERIGTMLAKLVTKGKLTEDQRLAMVERLQPSGSLSDLAEADFVVEAATEQLDLKLKIFRDTDQVLRKGVILASNTSSISITKLAASTSRPTNVIGMHFMNPVPLMKLVEIVRGVQTSDDCYQTTRQLCETMGKIVIASNDHPGFLVNRMLIPFLNEACFTLQEGVGSMQDIDQGAKLGLNHPMGPFELADLIGLDTVLSIAEVLHRDFGDDKYRAATVLRNLVAAGWLGKKSGRGFYVYDEKGQRTGPSLLAAILLK
jgi:3-hydroxybutyryl-CoA dehydrogenase